MTATERQQRRRLRLRREKAKATRDAEKAAKRQQNAARFADPDARRVWSERQAGLAAKHEAERQEWIALYQRNPIAGAAGPADELARQIAEYLAEAPEITINDVRAAIDRRFGPPGNA
jgi:hypothetical protein